ncbi:CapA family protein [Paenibacillus pinihumi]|uniref:CapA family protein n=1 Tax=Paenibacillus pinihumi TaxID=669462 RepID=UPI0004069B33|nr:CapA family protein [Paenibacillus pinihumi]
MAALLIVFAALLWGSYNGLWDNGAASPGPQIADRNEPGIQENRDKSGNGQEQNQNQEELPPEGGTSLPDPSDGVQEPDETPDDGLNTPADPNEGSQPPEHQPVNPQYGEEDEQVLLAFVGDILLAGSVQKQLDEQGYDYPYAKSLSYLADADLTAGNLESPFTTRGTPAEDKKFVFNGKPESLPALKDAGFNVVTLANNHTLDMGVEGLLDTMKHLDKAGIPHVGAGNNDTEAFTPVILEAKGIKVAYIGISRVVPFVEWKAEKYRAGVAESYDTTRAKAAIEKAKKEADLVVVMVHWGIERADLPENYQRSFAREYIDAGADLVIGSHPHVLQGFEQYKGKWIAYSMGNFIFNMTSTEKAAETGVLDAKCSRSGDCQMRFHPMKAVASQPALLEGEAAQTLLKRIEAISFGVKIDSEGKLSSGS